MTDLQVAQPVFTLVLHSMFRLRATTLPAIVGRGVGHSRLSRNALQTVGIRGHMGHLVDGVEAGLESI